MSSLVSSSTTNDLAIQTASTFDLPPDPIVAEYGMFAVDGMIQFVRELRWARRNKYHYIRYNMERRQFERVYARNKGRVMTRDHYYQYSRPSNVLDWYDLKPVIHKDFKVDIGL